VYTNILKYILHHLQLPSSYMYELRQLHSGESRRCSLEKVFSLPLIARTAAPSGERAHRAPWIIGHPAASAALPGQPAAATAYRWLKHSADSRGARRRTRPLLKAALPRSRRAIRECPNSKRGTAAAHMPGQQEAGLEHSTRRRSQNALRMRQWLAATANRAFARK